MTGGQWIHLDGAIPVFVTPGRHPLDSDRAKASEGEQAPKLVVSTWTGPGFKSKGPPCLLTTLPASATVHSPQPPRPAQVSLPERLPWHPEPHGAPFSPLHHKSCARSYSCHPSGGVLRSLGSLIHQGPQWISCGGYSTAFTRETAATVASAQWSQSYLVFWGCHWRHPSSLIPWQPPP